MFHRVNKILAMHINEYKEKGISFEINELCDYV